MTIDEKAQHIFMTISLWRKPSGEKAAAILDEHTALEKMAEEHKTLMRKTPRHRSKRKLPAPDVK